MLVTSLMWTLLLQEGKEYLRNYQQPNPRSYTRSKGYDFTNGHTGMQFHSYALSQTPGRLKHVGELII